MEVDLPKTVKFWSRPERDARFYGRPEATLAVRRTNVRNGDVGHIDDAGTSSSRSQKGSLQAFNGKYNRAATARKFLKQASS